MKFALRSLALLALLAFAATAVSHVTGGVFVAISTDGRIAPSK